MLRLDDDRWSELKGGYRTHFDPRPLLSHLEIGTDIATAWHGLWEGLHHQGDVGEASYAAVPHLVRIHRHRGVIDWNTYAIVAIIELARNRDGNSEVPKWLEKDYFHVEVDFAVSRPLVRRSRFISGFCPSTRTFAPRFLQTSFADE